MNDAEKHEKVIRGIEACNRISDYGRDCPNCPYYDDEDASELPFGVCNIQDMLADALVLLKAQEPRVLTLDEIKNDDVKICYFETRAGMLRGCVKELSTIPDSSTVYLVCGWKNDTYWRDFRGYGIVAVLDFPSDAGADVGHEVGRRRRC